MALLADLNQVKVKVWIGRVTVAEWLAKTRGRISIGNVLVIGIKGGIF